MRQSLMIEGATRWVWGVRGCDRSQSHDPTHPVSHLLTPTHRLLTLTAQERVSRGDGHHDTTLGFAHNSTALSVHPAAGCRSQTTNLLALRHSSSCLRWVLCWLWSPYLCFSFRLGPLRTGPRPALSPSRPARGWSAQRTCLLPSRRGTIVCWRKRLRRPTADVRYASLLLSASTRTGYVRVWFLRSARCLQRCLTPLVDGPIASRLACLLSTPRVFGSMWTCRICS